MSYTPVAQRRTTTKIDYIPVSRRTPQEKTPILSPFQLNLSIGRTQTTTPVIAEQGTVEEAGILGREVGQSISRNVASLVGSEAIAPVVNPVVKKIVDLEQKSPFFKAFTEDLGQRLYGDVEDLTPVEITGETRGEQIAPIGERVLAFEKRLEDKKKEYDELLKTPDLSKKERLILETLSAIIGEKKGTLAPVIIGSLVGLDVVPSFGSTDDFFKAMIKAQSRGEVVSLLRKVNVAEDLIEQFADDVVKVSSKKDAEKLFGSIAELQQSTKVVPRIAPELQPLAQEARKYKSAEEFVDRKTNELFNKLSNIEKRQQELNSINLLSESKARRIKISTELDNLAKQTDRLNRDYEPSKLTDFYNKVTRELPEFPKVRPKAPVFDIEKYNNALTELETARAGERVPILEGGQVVGYKGVKSTFPNWIPEGLRERKLLDSFLENRTGEIEDISIRYKAGSRLEQLNNAFLDHIGQPKPSKIRQMIRSKEIPSIEAMAKSTLETEIEISSTKPLLGKDDVLKELERPKSKLESETLLHQSLEVQAKDTEVLEEARSLPRIVTEYATDVKQKVGFLDYWRTPEDVIDKIGLGDVFKDLRRAYESYIQEIPIHHDLITEWSKRVSKEGNGKIFKYLDGRMDFAKLSIEEKAVATEVKDYLEDWALRLGLPEDNQISKYITHIFEPDFIKKEFDEDLAKIIADKVPGSVYDPFLEQRLGKKGYIEDTWRALDAYYKRAVRKSNMDSVLAKLKDASKRLELSQLRYVKRYVDRVNLRPTELDTLFDNTIKQIVGYRFGQRPVNALTRTGRQMVFRGTLGLNINSALKNLTQGVNTYAKLGEKYTAIGYIKLFTVQGREELTRSGIYKQDIIQDRVISSTRKMMQKADKALFSLFDMAEKINRGAAYWGAKSKGIAEGMTEEAAIEFAKKIVRETQFNYGSIDTPVALSSDIAKTIFQFGTFSLKQGEFLIKMMANKEWAGLIRYTLASLGLAYGLGQIFNIKKDDFIPVGYATRFGTPPLLAVPMETLKAVLGQSDLGNVLNKSVSIIPGGVQARKTIKGIEEGDVRSILGIKPQEKREGVDTGLPAFPKLPELPKIPTI